MRSDLNYFTRNDYGDAKATPEFIRWTLSRSCAVRDFDEATNPERTDRQLRSLRLYCEAVADGRQFEGVCLEPNIRDSSEPLGFLSEEVLSTYGGAEQIQQWCSQCPANAAKTTGTLSWAGCFGWFELSFLGDSLHQFVEDVIHTSNATLRTKIETNFLPTRPVWFGLWATSPLTEIQVQCHLEIADALSAANGNVEKTLREWRATLVAARQFSLPLHVVHFPAGVVQNNRWFVPACCERCHATRENPRRPCPACGWNSFPSPSRRRHVQGIRPYRPLKTFMTETQVADFLQRYHEQRNAISLNADEFHAPTFPSDSTDGIQR